jgi:hypothetical protein
LVTITLRSKVDNQLVTLRETDHFADLNSILSIDPGHQEGLKEIAAIQQLLQQHEDFSSPADNHPLDTAAAWEIPEDSDTEDCKHRGDSTYAAYNHGSCKEGRACLYSHGPDTMSVRDEL